MDATQTSDPTGVGPGTPGQASAFRRALDEQALPGEAKEGPLDLTVPLNFAEIRAALSSSGSNLKKPPAPEAAPVPTAGGARHGGRRRGGGHAAAPVHVGSKRLGRIGVFVALATALSMGTAAALVFSSGGQGNSVSLPTTNGNIPVATAPAAGGGQSPLGSPTPSAARASSASATPDAASASAAAFAAPTSASAAPDPSASATATGSPSASASSQGSASPSPTGSPFTTLQQGSTGTEVSQVQQLLVEIDLLMAQRDHRRTVFVDVEDYALADPSGSYGQATASAVAAFQQAAGVGADPGVCDQATFEALSAQASAQSSAQGGDY
ncbi:peptidoglycan-binding protein [Actinospica durhamensis]|uniref:Peptidoglycan-binding protein n=1 Tax=Actinospica durhamensis TaxID=1508375 RepID=A0A941INF8_9ACTN|nr:peptidoglycan-binding domain-containing protein [Actinospica durhamensis]MBR7833924.1 peptidoglycan-binding protein [Actinospica durhamensis]